MGSKVCVCVCVCRTLVVFESACAPPLSSTGLQKAAFIDRYLYVCGAVRHTHTMRPQSNARLVHVLSHGWHALKHDVTHTHTHTWLAHSHISVLLSAPPRLSVELMCTPLDCVSVHWGSLSVTHTHTHTHTETHTPDPACTFALCVEGAWVCPTHARTRARAHSAQMQADADTHTPPASPRLHLALRARLQLLVCAPPTCPYPAPNPDTHTHTHTHTSTYLQCARCPCRAHNHSRWVLCKV